jgi:hypothetical protein
MCLQEVLAVNGTCALMATLHSNISMAATRSAFKVLGQLINVGEEQRLQVAGSGLVAVLLGMLKSCKASVTAAGLSVLGTTASACRDAEWNVAVM